jgi:uncharacterized repeat protein (TIGR01451 family)
MKKIYTILLVLFFSLYSNAQIVDIPDLAFKNELLMITPTIDLDEDGEIQVSEALQVTFLNFSFCNFNNMIGIQEFANLQSLSLGSYVTITMPIDLTGMSSLKSLHLTKCSTPSINFEGLTNLESLSIGYGSHIGFSNFEDAVSLLTISLYSTHLTTPLDLSHAHNLTRFSSQNTEIPALTLDGLVNLGFFKYTNGSALSSNLNTNDLISLKYFELDNANLTALNFDHSPLLEELTFINNNLSTFDASNHPNLIKLSCYSNQLTYLDVSNNPNLELLICSENQLTALDLTNANKLKYVDASYNLLTAIDFSNLTEYASNENPPTYYINDNPNLIQVNLKNGKKDYIPMTNPINCPNLVYFCLDEMDFANQNYTFQQNGITNIQINTYCSFIPGGNYNTITGTLSLDIDNNGCDTNDFKFSDGKLGISNPNENGVTYSNTNGKYNFYTHDGDFTITPELENPYFTISPASLSLNFADSNNNTQTQNFCIVPNGIHNDLEITILPLVAPRPGFDTHYRLTYKNKGNQILSGNINLTFDDAILDLVSATPSINSQSLNVLHWSYNTLKPFETSNIDFTLNVNSPQETPAVNNDDVLNFIVSIDPVVEDETTADNTFTLSQTVVGSLDPNDKTCLEGNSITPEMVGDYLHYIIRFQNTGTAEAENVVVKDIIDTTKFDMASLQLTSASHPQVTKITGNKVEFQFEDVDLPAASEDETASHGHIAFKIKTKADLTLGNTVSNKADIYFDYNFPIETNTATSTVETLLSMNSFENTSVKIAPNPVQTQLHIISKDNITSVQLFDVQGRILETTITNDKQVDFDLSQKTSGVYFIKIYTVKGVKIEKVIKE